jgi:arylsulfatase A-like enzyme
VSLVDIYPTVLDLLGRDANPPTQGVSLEPLMRGMPCSRGPIVGEMQPWTKRPPYKPWLWFMVSGDDKIIYDVNNHTYQVYDLAADPDEQDNLVEIDPSRFERLRRQLHAQVTARIALPEGSSAAETLRFGPLPPGTQK